MSLYDEYSDKKESSKVLPVGEGWEGLQKLFRAAIIMLRYGNGLNKKGKKYMAKNFNCMKKISKPFTCCFAGSYRMILQPHNWRLDLQKGILLSGPVGCGKTTLMSLMKYIVQQPEHKFITKSCRDISFEFIEDGFSVIHKYSKRSIVPVLAKKYCFDDLGAENSLKYYGNECNVMAEILLTRYDLFIAQNLMTHVTTNLSASEIEEAYGNRIRSRMREMFNLIAFDNNSEDKRQ